MNYFHPYIYLIKFFIFGGIATYDYATGSKWTMGWFLLALLMLVFLLLSQLKQIKK